jgi:hypothetical protein
MSNDLGRKIRRRLENLGLREKRKPRGQPIEFVERRADGRRYLHRLHFTKGWRVERLSDAAPVKSFRKAA